MKRKITPAVVVLLVVVAAVVGYLALRVKTALDAASSAAVKADTAAGQFSQITGAASGWLSRVLGGT